MILLTPHPYPQVTAGLLFVTVDEFTFSIRLYKWNPMTVHYFPLTVGRFFEVHLYCCMYQIISFHCRMHSIEWI